MGTYLSILTIKILILRKYTIFPFFHTIFFSVCASLIGYCIIYQHWEPPARLSCIPRLGRSECWRQCRIGELTHVGPTTGGDPEKMYPATVHRGKKWQLICIFLKKRTDFFFSKFSRDFTQCIRTSAVTQPNINIFEHLKYHFWLCYNFFCGNRVVYFLPYSSKECNTTHYLNYS